MSGLAVKHTHIKAIAFVCMLVISLALQAQAAPLLQRITDKENRGHDSNEAIEQNRAEINRIRYELTQQIEMLQEELQRLRGVLEEQNYTIEQLRKGERERYADLDARINNLQSSSVLTPTVTAGEDGSGNTVAITNEDERTYNSAKQKVDAKEYNAAIAEFTLYLEFFPEGKYVPQAHYWMGELYMGLEIPEYDNAEKHFQTVIKDFPNHAKVPGALYKLGLIYKAKNNAAKARENFERLVREFPQSSTASLAKNQLGTL